MDRVQISGMSRVIRLLVGLSVMVLAVSAGRFLGIEQVNNLVDQAMAVASAQGPRITIQKFTNGHDADDAPGPSIFVGRALTWEYEIHNPNATGDLRSISLFDDKEGQIPCPLSVLAPGASMTCTRPGTAMDGPYENTASVFAFWVSTGGGTRPSSASDSSHYVGTPGPRELKTEALDALRAFVPSPPFDRSAQRRLGRAIDHVDRSLRADLWVDAYRRTRERAIGFSTKRTRRHTRSSGFSGWIWVLRTRADAPRSPRSRRSRRSQGPAGRSTTRMTSSSR